MTESGNKWEAHLKEIPGMPDKFSKEVEEVDDFDLEMMAALEELPSSIAAKVVNTANSRSEPAWEQLIDHKWCICEMAEGDFPRVFCFANLQSMIEAVAKREGSETAIWPMFGVPLQISKPLNTLEGGVIRYLILPNGKAAVVSKSAAFKIVDQSLLPANLEIQDEGWLGDPDYVSSKEYYEAGFIEADAFTDDPDEENTEDGNV